MRTFIKYAESLLLDIYPKEEVDSIIYRLISNTLNINRAQFLIMKSESLSTSQTELLHTKLSRLATGEPLQYILGETEFYGLNFNVAPGVLIPRPETEELIDLIVKENPVEGVRILDIGTGSGCIAISLAANLTKSVVQAWDISSDALAIAQKNALINNQEVRFFEKDILSYQMRETDDRFDIIVSNPPYVCEKEKNEMHQNVLKHEPHLALFVPDKDPLLFYRTIAQMALLTLLPKGKLYFEINQSFGIETQKLLIDLGYKNVRLLKDLFGKDRFVCAEL